jgi:hypothetical protein
MVLGSTQTLTKMSNGGKGGWCVGLTTLPPSCADCLKTRGLNLLEPYGSVQTCNGIALPFPPGDGLLICPKHVEV